MTLLSIFIVSTLSLTSVVYADDALSKQYRTYKALIKTGKVSLRKKDYQTAIDKYSKAIEMSPFEASSYYSRGVALYKSGKVKEAEEDFDRVILLDFRMNSAYVYRGLCRVSGGKYKEALSDYKRALNFKPNDAGIHNNLAWLYAIAADEKVQDNARALEHAGKAAELSKNSNAEILDTLARAYFINGKVNDAVETEKKAIKLSPDSKQFKDNLKMYEEKNAGKAGKEVRREKE
jgi:tetratricopeptide (TPR) repeat protein